MWKKLECSSSYYISLAKECNYYIFITDYIKIWSVLYSEEQFLKCLMDSNLGLEIDKTELLDKGTEMLLLPENLKSAIVSQNVSFLTVSMSMSFGYPLYLNLELKEGSNELKITQPLLMTVQDLRSSEQELCLILKAKEEEIIEYKSLGVKIRYTATPQFKELEHMKKHSTFISNFATSHVSRDLLEKIVDIPETKCNLKQELEHVAIKTEPSSNPAEHTQVRIEMETVSLKQDVKIENVDSKPFIPKKKQKRLNI